MRRNGAGLLTLWADEFTHRQLERFLKGVASELLQGLVYIRIN
jgi:hypothetical protein